jgi:hypothetical protein
MAGFRNFQIFKKHFKTGLFRTGKKFAAAAAALASSEGIGDGAYNDRANEGVMNQLRSLFNVYSDPACNARLLVLIIGQVIHRVRQNILQILVILKNH